MSPQEEEFATRASVSAGAGAVSGALSAAVASLLGAPAATLLGSQALGSAAVSVGLMTSPAAPVALVIAAGVLGGLGLAGLVHGGQLMLTNDWSAETSQHNMGADEELEEEPIPSVIEVTSDGGSIGDWEPVPSETASANDGVGEPLPEAEQLAISPPQDVHVTSDVFLSVPVTQLASGRGGTAALGPAGPRFVTASLRSAPGEAIYKVTLATGGAFILPSHQRLKVRRRRQWIVEHVSGLLQGDVATTAAGPVLVRQVEQCAASEEGPFYQFHVQSLPGESASEVFIQTYSIDGTGNRIAHSLAVVGETANH